MNEAQLAAARARRWWQTRRPVRTIERAADFIDDVGFALLFPARGLALPSLYNAATDRLGRSLWEVEWGPDAERVWSWKDDLPVRSRAWYGKFLAGRASFLSPEMLGELYPRSGRPDDFTEETLSEDARHVAEVLLLSGPTPTPDLREALAMEGKKGQSRFSRAIVELGRRLVVTNFGVSERGGGWPAAVLELTARAFDVPGPGRSPERQRAAAARFLRTMIQVRPIELGKAVGWPAGDARRGLEELASRGQAARDGDVFGPA